MKHFSALLLLFTAFSFNTFAQYHSQEAGLQTDNDSYLARGSDRYYTNGIFLYYRKALKLLVDSTKLANKILGFEAGQKMFNPRTGYIPDARYVDRPFAAYLYIGSTLNLLYKNESNLKLGAQIGIVGPAALGKEAQDVIHNTFGFYPPTGWQYQIQNDPELNLSAEYNKLLARASWIDASLYSYGNLGNGFTGAGVGPLIRLGNFSQLFNSVSTQSTAIASNTKPLLHQHELFFYLKPVINYVAYDATVEGSLFKNHDAGSQEITKGQEPFIFSQQIGGAYTSNRWVFDLSAIFHTKDVKQMVRVHQWASVTALYRFR